MKQKLKIFIIAGEVSGDVLGGKIMHAIGNPPSPKLRGTKDAHVEFAGIGGENMAGAGLNSIFPISDLAVMGLFEVLAHARTLTRRINETADAIVKYQPDIVLSIDSPGFVKRVIKKVKSSEFRVQSSDKNNCNLNSELCTLFYHVVAPQVWAWGPRRAKKFAKIFDRLYCFFDFEVPYFTKYGLKTIAVGHPIADGLKPARAHAFKKNIALIPGSRMSEVKKMLPVMRRAAEQICPPTASNFPRVKRGVVLCDSPQGGSSRPLSQYVTTPPLGGVEKSHSDFSVGGQFKFFIPVVETTKNYIEQETKNWTVPVQLVPAADRYKLFEKTDIAIAASGTVSTELAIMHVPAIVVYKMNPLTMFLARMVVKTKWVSLVNILLKKTVYPELLGGNASPENIAREVAKLYDANTRKKMISELSRADKMWRHGNSSPAKLIADDILK